MGEERISLDEAKSRIAACAGDHVVFDGLSDAALNAAAEDAEIPAEMARAAFPRGAQDLGVEMHLIADRALADQLATEDMTALRYSEKVARAIMIRLEIAGQNKEAVRRAANFFALPQNAVAGSKCIWNTADTIWTALGDTSDDLNWYSKRTILSGVYSASLLYWLGDESEGSANTMAFVDRRIENVMAFEKTKGQIKKSKAYQAFRSGPGRFLDRIKAPGPTGMNDLPGQWRRDAPTGQWRTDAPTGRWRADAPTGQWRK